MSGSGSGNLFVSARNYSANLVILLTFIWMLGIARILPAKLYRDLDFTLVTNRMSSNLSNIGFLLTAGVYAGITSTLFAVLLRVIMYFSTGKTQIINNGFQLALGDLLLGMFISILYLVLFAALGYLFGVLSQINVMFVIAVPAVIIGLAFVQPGFLKAVFKFFTSETSLFLFTLKILLTSFGLFALSILLSDRMEVRK